MEYVPPLGAAADAAYVDANPALGVEGSAVPAASIEHPQREIVQAISDAGLTPDGADLGQLSEAIQALIASGIAAIVNQLPPGFIRGFKLSNSGGDLVNDIAIGTGVCRDFDNTRNVTLAAPVTKRLDAFWAAGDGAGGLFGVTAKAPDTSYHMILIDNDLDPRLADAGFSTSPIGADAPSGWTARRRVGSLYTLSASELVRITQLGDEFLLVNPVMDLLGVPPTTTGTLHDMSVPTGIQVDWLGNWIFDGGPSEGTSRALITSPDQADIAPTIELYNIQALLGNVALAYSTVNGPLRTNILGQLRSRSTTTTGGSFDVLTTGWIDQRGREAA